MFKVDFYDLLMDVSAAFAPVIRTKLSSRAPAPPLLQVRRGYAESPAWFMMQALEFDPEPMTVPLLRVRDVYASERIVQAILELLAAEGWLARNAENEYHLTTAGRETIVGLRNRRWEVVADLHPLPEEQLTALHAALQRVITTSLLSSSPPGTWCLAHSRRRAPAVDAPALLQIYHFLDDFNAFRDDAHMAAWKTTGVPGCEWESFALVCRGEANNATSLHDKLRHRGYSCYEYGLALERCQAKGWLEGNKGIYHASADGQTVQATVEYLTDDYFFTPWAMLGSKGFNQAKATLIELREALLTGLFADA